MGMALTLPLKILAPRSAWRSDRTKQTIREPSRHAFGLRVHALHRDHDVGRLCCVYAIVRHAEGDADDDALGRSHGGAVAATRRPCQSRPLLRVVGRDASAR